ncbi:MAG: hypothetical protein IKI02_08360, partial [Oscillospiraceae bacterium]|nr:hypothetical protein [Oscillospiraceae bacterium]
EAPAGALWTLENGSAAGRFLLKDEAGLYVSNPSGTTLKLTESGTEFVVGCGSGSASIKLATNATRQIFFRSNDLGQQFRCYSTTNATAESYSAVLTIYKPAD